MKKLMLATVFSLTGCASINPIQVSGPSGKTAYTMRCSGAGRTLEACYQKAGEVCPNGYTMVDRSTGTKSIPANGGFMMVNDHNLTVECK